MSNQHGPYDVVIAGAGFAGIGLATKLRREGLNNFVILERADDVGGTWRDNHYPGAACDVPSHLYSFAHRPNPDWSHIFAPQKEILEYIRASAREEQIDDRIEFNAEVLSAEWSDLDSVWTIISSAGTYTARVFISAVGHLSDPKMPAIQGIESFAGKVFHSANWDDDYELAGKRVAVIGTGASSVQIVPSIAPVVEQLTVFQRSAPYITARPDREYTTAEKRMFHRLPETLAAQRRDMFWANEERYAQRRGTPSLVQAVQSAALNHLASQIPAGPLRDKLTPDYTIGCKRILKSDDYFPAFLQANVSLETTPIVEVVGSGIRTADGALHELDVIVASTGFEAVDLPIAHRVYGRGRELLAERWNMGMQAYATVAVNGFPNFWIINGPNTGLGHNSSVYVAEAQIEHIVEAISHVLESAAGMLEVARAVEDAYSAQVDSMSQGTVWLDGGCRSWYVDARSNRLTTIWPDFAFSFREVNSPFDAERYGDDNSMHEIEGIRPIGQLAQ
ncbi:NAD(P)/FAD-dependent oxidoreductase [Mycetocola sp. 2940]|uniref:flavin-containing monooxygenase n=1 Tax=Mycetocola sp. 2940 TaxID=3156452 RepID=UPI0033940A0F